MGQSRVSCSERLGFRRHQGLAVDSSSESCEEALDGGRSQGFRAVSLNCGPQPLHPTDQIGLVKDEESSKTVPRTH